MGLSCLCVLIVLNFGIAMALNDRFSLEEDACNDLFITQSQTVCSGKYHLMRFRI